MVGLPEQRTYAHGELIRATLLIRWREEFDEAMVEFHKPHSLFGGTFGNLIVLQSQNQQRIAEGPQPYTKVELEGVVPDWARSGTYVCKYVRCFVPGRGWVTLFEDVHQVTLRVKGRIAPPPLQGKEGAEFLGMEFQE